MTWVEYTSCISLLMQTFGKTFYDNERVKAGYKTWASRPKSTLMVQIQIAIETNTPFDLFEPVPAAKRPERAVYRGESYYQTDDYLSKFLALKGCSSLAEVLEKEIANQRTKK